MVKFCLCRPHHETQEVMEKVELHYTNVKEGESPNFLDIPTRSGARRYNAYECKYCGRLQFFRALEPSEGQETLVTA